MCSMLSNPGVGAARVTQAGKQSPELDKLVAFTTGSLTPSVVLVSGCVDSATSTTNCPPSGAVITVVGNGFGTSPTVLVSGVPCTGVQVISTDIVVSCTLAAGSGTNLPVVVSNSLGSSPQTDRTVSYLPYPVVSSVSGCTTSADDTVDCPSAGGTRITVNGLNFVTGPFSVSIGGSVCTSVIMTVPNTQLQCTLPAGSGSNIVRVTETLTGHTSVETDKLVVYVGTAPTVTRISGCVDVADDTTQCPAAGGTLVTISGTNLGTVATSSVLIGASSCAGVVFLIPAAQLSCFLPPGSGTNIVRVTNQGQTSSQIDILASYATQVVPSIASVSGCTDSGVSTLLCPTSGGVTITISGTNFDPAATVLVGNSICSNPLANPVGVRITCTLPAGTGSNAVRVVQPGGQTSQEVDRLVSYSSTTLTPVVNSVSGCTDVAADTTQCPTSGGVRLTINGGNFGSSGASVFVGSVACSSVIYTAVDTQLTCILPAGTGTNIVTIQRGGLSSASSRLVTYTGVTTPIVTRVTGCVASGTSTTQCPSSGGIPITIDGSYFGNSGATVTVGAAQCTGVSYVISTTRLTCTLPAGLGTNVVSVSLLGATSLQTDVLVTYATTVPTVSTISGCTDVGSNTINCPQSGGLTITITGNNLGSTGAIVTVGSALCSSVTHTVANLQLTCTLPSGTGTNLVQVFAPGGTATSTSTVTYASTVPTGPSVSSCSGCIASGSSTIDCPASGGVTLTVLGSRLGSSGSTITIGGVACPNVQYIVANAFLTCTLPAGAGSGKVVSVTNSGQTSTETAVTVSYLVTSFPIISSVSGCTDSSGSTMNCPQQGGVLLVINGANLGTTGGTLLIGTTVCPSLVHTVSTVQLQCTLPAGSGTNVVSFTSSGGATSQQGDKTVSYAASSGTPVIASVSGCTDVSADDTINCPSAGGITLTVTGSGFGTVGAVIRVGTALCLNVVYLSTDTRVTCTLPAGSGTNVVTVTQAGLTSLQANKHVTYAGTVLPALTTVSGCTDVGVSTALCPRTGGTTLTVTGSGLGAPSNPATVLVGGVACSAVSYLIDGSKLTCVLPAGTGTVVVTATVSGLTSVQTDRLVGYSTTGLPSVTRISGCSDVGDDTTQCPAAGGALITVFGTGFGGSGAVVRIGTTPCNGVVYLVTDQQLRCILPSGSGAGVVSVTTSIGTSTEVDKILYYIVGSAPIVTSVAGCTNSGDDTVNCPAGGGLQLTVFGSNFGGAGATITVGNQQCTNPVHVVPDIQMVCVLPAGVGAQSVVVTQSGVASLQTDKLVIYAASTAPVLSRVSGCVDDNLSTRNCPIGGGIPLTIYGSNFGGSGASVTVGTTLCASVVYVISGTQLQCTLPSGIGTNIVTVTTPTGVSSQTDRLVMYANSITPVVSSVRGCTDTGDDTVQCPTVGVRITITGSNFGSSGAVVSVGTLSCTTVAYTIPDQQLTCFLSQSGVGLNNPVVVTVSGQSSVQTDKFVSYAPPSVTNVRGCQDTSDDTMQCPTSGGTLLTINGANFGVFGATVSVGSQQCTSVTHTVPHTQLTCRLPSGTSSGLPVTVTQAGQTSLDADKTVSYAFTPVLSSVRGCIDSGVSTAQCPSTGGVTLTLSGSNFGTAGASVTIGTVPCLNVVHSVANFQLLCLLAAGTGSNLIVRVTQAGATSVETSSTVSYSSTPVVLRVSGCVDAGSSTLLCPSSGGTTLTITGQNLGSAPAVLVGSAPCSGVSVISVDTQIVCRLPATQGSNLPVVVIWQGVSSQQTDKTVSYASGPAISSVSGCIDSGGSTYQCPAGGGVLLTVSGSGFGVSGSTVTVGGNLCAGTSYVQAQTIITCALPAGSGSLNQVFVTANGITSTQTDKLVGYSSGNSLPVITGVSGCPGSTSTGTTLCPTSGGTRITITGSGFTAAAVVLVNGTICTNIVLASSVQLTCILPAGVGTNLPISISQMGISTTSARQVSYAAPIVTRVQGCTDSGQVTQQCPTSGGLRLTITGDNFGTSAASITLGSQTCSAVVHTLPSQQLTCTLPAGTGANIPVIVSQGGQFSAEVDRTVSYSGSTILVPTITRVQGCVDVGLSTVGCAARGGALLTISGQNFGTAGAQVTVGGLTCTSVTHSVANTQVQCLLPAGAGVGNIVGVTSSPGIRSGEIDKTVGYSAPTIATVRGCTDQGLGTTQCPTTGGTRLTIDGQDFVASDTTVTIGGTPCTNVVITVAYTQLTCQLPVGVGTSLPVTVTSQGQSSAQLDRTVSFGAPAVTEVRGCTDSAKSTTQCPTSGATLLTVYGSNFGAAGAGITIGGFPCASVVYMVPHAVLRCTLGLGSGASLPVVVTVSGQSSAITATTPTVSYTAIPSVTSVSGCVDTGASTTQCPVSGGTIITVQGSGFGVSGATVLVGGVACASVAHLFADTALTCKLPAGTGTSPVVVTAATGLSSSTSAVYVSYASGVPRPIVNSVRGCSDMASGDTADCPSAGSIQITINGVNFGSSGASALVGTVPCAGVVYSISGSQLTCVLPPGTGTQLVTVVQSGQLSQDLRYVQYHSAGSATPVIGTISGCVDQGSVTTKCSSGTKIFISGSGFGSSGATVYVGSALCASVTHLSADILLSCILPAGSGTQPVVVTTAAGVSSAAVSNAISYVQAGTFPSISSISGCADVASITTSCPTAGGVLLTVNGYNFGSAGASVTVGGAACINVKYVVTGSQITCTLPAGSDTQIVVVTDSQNTTSQEKDKVVSYVSTLPTISSVSGCVNVGVSTTQCPADGGIFLTINGNNFGQQGATVTVGMQACTPVLHSIANVQLICALPAGNSTLPVIVRTSSGKVSAESDRLVAYAAAFPSITGVSGCVNVASVTTQCPLTGGVPITITGNFPLGTSLNTVVSVGNQACVPVSYVLPGAQLTCTLPSGSGTVVVGVTIGAKSSAERDKTVSYVGDTTPAVSSIAGCSASGSSTKDCSTSGGTPLTITGAQFGTSGAQVTIGGTLCQSVVHTVPNTQLTCLLPAGSGALLPTVVTSSQGLRSVQTDVLVSYAAPRVDRVSGCVDVGDDTTQCLGGGTISVFGSNFGTSGAVVRVGAQPCTSLLYASPHQQLVCSLPSGSGTVSITVTLNGQSSAQGDKTVTYSEGPTVVSVAGCVPSGLGIVDCSPGTTVTITGQSFGTSGATAKIGGLNCAQTLHSTLSPSTQLTCVLPATSGQLLPVIVTLPNGASSSPGSAVVSYIGDMSVTRVRGCADVGSSTQDCPTSGVAITVDGLNFGSATTPTISAGGIACTNVQLIVPNVQLRCVLSPGVGTNLPVVLTKGGSYSSQTDKFVSYGRPVITSVEGCQDQVDITAGCPTSGGILLTVNGLDFGITNAQVTVGGQSCANVQHVVPHVRLTCQLPPGAGVQRVVVSQASQDSVQQDKTVAYLVIPQISRVRGCTDSGVSTTQCQSGMQLTITGNGFGSNGAVVYVGPFLCLTTVYLVPGTEISCTLPSAAGNNLVVQVSLSGVKSQEQERFVSFVASTTVPSVMSVSGCTDIDFSTGNCPTAGGSTITVLGSNFGSLGASINIGGSACTNVVHTISDSQLTCTLPAGSGTKAVRVQHLSGLQSSETNIIVSYVGVPIVSRVRGCNIIGTSVNNCPTTGQVSLTIDGFGFTSAPAVVIGTQACSPVSIVAAGTSLQCILQPGSGANLTVKVTQNLFSSPQTNRLVSYGAPIITTVTGCPIGPDGSLQCSSTTTTITISGGNLGASGSTVTVGSTPCTRVTYIQPHTQITCEITTNGAALALVVSLSGQSSLPSTALLSATSPADAPVVSSVRGCVDLSDDTTQCPQTGATVLTITGARLGNNSYQTKVFIGNAPCTNVIFTTPNAQLTCNLPSNTQGARAVIVLRDTRQSMGNSSVVVYQGTPAPVVMSISGCGSDSAGNTNLCAESGGTVVTITGQNFGPGGATVFVGGTACSNVQQPIADTLILCQLPSGAGIKAVTVTQAGQTSAATHTVSYGTINAGPPGQASAPVSSSSTDAALIVGLILGGLILLALILLAAWVAYQKSRDQYAKDWRADTPQEMAQHFSRVSPNSSPSYAQYAQWQPPHYEMQPTGYQPPSPPRW
eukprot:TRINITY_DN7013_c0_g1_i3.p1 TRINITY_DN7013_c0_g1~~TRINITY_DN7013_c0_g1_i3.p1  ORF type:complete len:4070 (-),score=286.73 TRINITY_DN7013_c0_g1_i3:31-12240(-)